MIETLRELRRATSEALVEAFTQSSNQASEVELRDAFHQRLIAIPNTTEEGWYVPPPHGIVLAIGNPPHYERVGLGSYRPESAWPSATERLTNESIVLAYSSRAHTPTGLIGDMACTLYRGDDPKIKAHLADVWNITMAIANEAEVGLPFNELYRRAGQLIDKAGFANNIYSAHDGNTTNIGHTIPWSTEAANRDELGIIEHGTSEQISELISDKRQFVSAAETTEIADTVAFTIEPRLSGPNLPTVNFHVVVAFVKNQRAIITEFDPLFTLFGMDYLNA